MKTILGHGDPTRLIKQRNHPRRHGKLFLAGAVFAVFLNLNARAQAVFNESGGLVVMEAEHYWSNAVASGHSWVSATNVAGFAGTSAMQAMPNTGLSISSGVTTSSPALKYQVQFNRTGNYKFWIRGWAASGSDDSIYVGVDDRSPQSLSYSQTGAWVWKSGQVSITNAGLHVVNLWMREDGAYVDRLLLTTNLTYTPTNAGPPETGGGSTGGTTFRYAPVSNRIYVENGGTVTLSDIARGLTNAPLCLVDPVNKVWFLSATLVLSDGVTLMVHGTQAGGDANELRLRSDNSFADGSCACIDADWGSLDFKNVKVTSWDQLTSSPDTEYATYSRAFIRARSRLVGSTYQQSALHVMNSEIACLGVNSDDEYGLTWQVIGGVPGLTVSGCVSNSYVHGCVLGLASSLWSDVPWYGNTIVSNTMSGFAPYAGNTIQSNQFDPVYRWAGTSQRIYVTGPGDATLSELKAAMPDVPITLVDPVNKIWHLGVDLYVENGARLKLYGPAIGGDVGELRLKSERSTAADAFVELRADYGWLDIRNTRITSWDSVANGPQTITNYGRAFIHARSTLDPDGHTPHESRMDVINSDIGYLGHHASEAYGLVWKVVDTTAIYLPPGSTNTLYDLVNVYGDITGSHIHHNFFGVYTFGHYGGNWSGNEVDHNMAYGFDPHDDSDYLLIENNHVHHNGWHGIIASKRCDHGVMRNNISHDNGLDLISPHGNGLMLHRSCSDWLVENNQSYNNPDSGIAIFASDRILIRNNVCTSNANAGIRMSVGSELNRIEGNQFVASGRHGIYLYQGSDLPEMDEETGELDSGRDALNVFTNNIVNGYGLEALKVRSGDSNVFAGNVFIGRSTLLLFSDGTNNVVDGNILPSDTLAKLQGEETNATYFTSTTFANQSRLTVQMDLAGTSYFTDKRGAIFYSIQTNLTTTVSPPGSLVTLTPAQLGTGPSQVTTRNLFALPTSGSAQLTVTGWINSGNRSKTWTLLASSPAMQIQFRVGDLSPNTSYTVRRDGYTLSTINSDSQGFITFTSTPASTALVTFNVRH